MFICSSRRKGPILFRLIHRTDVHDVKAIGTCGSPQGTHHLVVHGVVVDICYRMAFCPCLNRLPCCSAYIFILLARCRTLVEGLYSPFGISPSMRYTVASLLVLALSTVSSLKTQDFHRFCPVFIDSHLPMPLYLLTDRLQA